MFQNLRQSVTPLCSYKIHFSVFPLRGDIGLDGRQYFFNSKIYNSRFILYFKIYFLSILLHIHYKQVFSPPLHEKDPFPISANNYSDNYIAKSNSPFSVFSFKIFLNQSPLSHSFSGLVSTSFLFIKRQTFSVGFSIAKPLTFVRHLLKGHLPSDSYPNHSVLCVCVCVYVNICII